jgi:hypothetical protein
VRVEGKTNERPFDFAQGSSEQCRRTKSLPAGRQACRFSKESGRAIFWVTQATKGNLAAGKKLVESLSEEPELNGQEDLHSCNTAE